MPRRLGVRRLRRAICSGAYCAGRKGVTNVWSLELYSAECLGGCPAIVGDRLRPAAPTTTPNILLTGRRPRTPGEDTYGLDARGV
jgi:hypothetical protein